MKVEPHPDIPGALTFAAQERPDGWVEDLPADPKEPTRTLYHFTSVFHMPIIMESGIAKGDVALSPETGYNAPWLTDDDDWGRQGWAGGQGNTEIQAALDSIGLPVLIPKTRRALDSGNSDQAFDKAAVRLSVEVPADSPLLHHWPELAEAEGVPDFWYESLDRVGGGGSDHWYVFKGRIPVTWISGIAVRHDKSLRGKWGFKAKTDPSP